MNTNFNHSLEDHKTQRSVYSNVDIKNDNQIIKVISPSGNDISNSIFKKIKSKTPKNPTTIQSLQFGWDLIDRGFNRVSFFKESSFSWHPPIIIWECYYNMQYGIEVGIHSSGKTYFINHITKEILFNYPSIEPTERGHVKIGEKLSITITLEETKNSGFGINFEEGDSELIVKDISTDSCFLNNLSPDDILYSVDQRRIGTSKEFFESLKNKKKVQLKVIRKIYQPDSFIKSGKPYKSNIMSNERRKITKAKPISVHFNDKPVLLEYKYEASVEKCLTESIEANFSNILKIELETGMIKSVHFSKEKTVEDVINQIASKNYFFHPQCFTLALIAEGDSNIILFNPGDYAYEVLDKKKLLPDYTCKLLLYAFPPNIDDWKDKKYSSMIYYLFHQSRNFLLRANMAWLSNLSAHDLHQLISFSATVEFIISGLKTLEIATNVENENGNGTHNIDGEVPKTNRTRSTGDIRLSSLKLEQWNYYTNVSALKNLRKDIDGYVIVNMMLGCFDEIVPARGKVFLLGNTDLCRNLDISIDENFKNEMESISTRAQRVFVKSTIASKIVGYYRYRILLCRCPIQSFKQNSKIVGCPYTFVVSSKEFGIEDQNGIYTRICYFCEVRGIVISFKDEERFLFNIFGLQDDPTSAIVKKEDYQSLKHLLYSFSTMIWLKPSNNYIPIIDLTDSKFRCSNMKINYSDYHLILPSKWNYISGVSDFMLKYSKLGPEKSNMNTQDVDSLLPWLMIFSDDEKPVSGSIGVEPLIVCNHVYISPYARPNSNFYFDLSTEISNSISSIYIDAQTQDKTDDEEEDKFSKIILADEVEIRKKGKNRKISLKRSEIDKIDPVKDQQNSQKLKTKDKIEKKGNKAEKKSTIKSSPKKETSKPKTKNTH